MERHINVLAVLYIVYGAIGLLIAALFFAGFVSGSLILDDRKVIELTTSMAIAVAFLLVLTSIPQVIVGFGLLQQRSWTLILANILSVINLFSFPFGTAIGVYSLWVLSKPQVRALLRPSTQTPDIIRRFVGNRR